MKPQTKLSIALGILATLYCFFAYWASGGNFERGFCLAGLVLGAPLMGLLTFSLVMTIPED